MGKGGRPSKLTPEVVNTICQYLARGCTRRDAAYAAGVSYEAFAKWMQQGRKDAEAGRQSKFLQFLHAVERAEAELRARLAETIVKAGEENWRAALEYLERRDPKNWGRETKLGLTADETPFVLEIVVRKSGRDETQD